MKLGEIDTIKETFSADVFIKSRWREPRLDGSETAKKKVSLPATEIFDLVLARVVTQTRRYCYRNSVRRSVCHTSDHA